MPKQELLSPIYNGDHQPRISFKTLGSLPAFIDNVLYAICRFWDAYQTVIPVTRHIGKSKTNHIERLL